MLLFSWVNIFNRKKKNISVDSVISSLENRDTKALKKMLQNGLDPNTFLQKDELTALHYCAKHNLPEIWKLLLKFKANPLKYNSANLTPIHYAIKFKHLDLIETLLKDVDVQKIQHYGGQTLLHFGAESGNYDFCNKYFNILGVDINNQKNELLLSPLHLAVKSQDQETIKFFLDQKANPNSLSKEGTPFYWAACFGQLSNASILLKYGANPDIAGSGGTPLQLTICFGRNQVFKEIIDRSKIDLNKADIITGETPLQGASKNGNYYATQTLIGLGVEIDELSQTGNNALHLAALNGHLKILKYLIQNGANKNKLNKEGQTPLILASKRQHTSIVKTLIENNAEQNIKDHSGKTAYDYSCIHKTNSIKSLLEIQK